MFISRKKHRAEIASVVKAKKEATARLESSVLELLAREHAVHQICLNAKGNTVSKRRILEALGYEV